MAATAQTAVLTAHGQPSAPEQPERALALLARETARYLPGWEVRSATLSTPGRLQAQAAPGAVVYPFFMARGWFTAKVLPDRLQGIPHRMACPFGLDPALSRLAAAAVRQSCADQGWQPEATHLLLAAHGSARGPKAAEATEAFARALQPLLPGTRILTGYIEQAPGIRETAAGLPPQSLCLPFFAQSGDHVRQDIPEALETAAFPGLLLPVAGRLPGVPQLIAQAILASASGAAAAG
ncbi:CbiX/SirB N-terminal domain-containing protein [Roseobacteraceae bacterium NS-SX3]